MLGSQETVNAVDPDTIARLYGDGALAKAGDGAVVGDDYASKHGLHVGDTLTLTSLKGAKLPLEIRAIEDTPSVDVLSLGPITPGACSRWRSSPRSPAWRPPRCPPAGPRA